VFAFRARNGRLRVTSFFMFGGQCAIARQAIRNHSLSTRGAGFLAGRIAPINGHGSMKATPPCRWKNGLVKIEWPPAAKLYVTEKAPVWCGRAQRVGSGGGATSHLELSQRRAYFSNLRRVDTGTTQAVKRRRAGEAVGAWELKATTDQSPLREHP